MWLMFTFCINGALKTRNSQRIKFRALRETMIGYFSRALTELISRHVCFKVPLEQVHYQYSFGAAPTAAVGEVNGYDDADEKHSPNDANHSIAVHRPHSHVDELAALNGA